MRLPESIARLAANISPLVEYVNALALGGLQKDLEEQVVPLVRDWCLELARGCHGPSPEAVMARELLEQGVCDLRHAKLYRPPNKDAQVVAACLEELARTKYVTAVQLLAVA